MMMKRVVGSTLSLFVTLAAGISGSAFGQDQPASHMPPKVLTVTREYTKPGKSGTVHEKAESAFVQAMTQAKWPTHYIAVESLSGKSRALFLTGYESFEAWEKDVKAVEKNAALSAALDRAYAGDGELLADEDSVVLAFREDYSLRPQADIAHARYFEISHYQVKEGHDKDWDEIVKLVTAAYEKIPDAHWDAYECVYGLPHTSYIILVPIKSATEIDKSFAEGKDFEAAMGEEGMRKLGELTAAAIETSQTNLFAFNPRMSYPSDDWVKADPEFWKPKGGSAAAVAKKPGAKAAENH
jgi:hypothetical protein